MAVCTVLCWSAAILRCGSGFSGLPAFKKLEMLRACAPKATEETCHPRHGTLEDAHGASGSLGIHPQRGSGSEMQQGGDADAFGGAGGGVGPRGTEEDRDASSRLHHDDQPSFPEEATPARLGPRNISPGSDGERDHPDVEGEVHHGSVQAGRSVCQRHDGLREVRRSVLCGSGKKYETKKPVERASSVKTTATMAKLTEAVEALTREVAAVREERAKSSEEPVRKTRPVGTQRE